MVNDIQEAHSQRLQIIKTLGFMSALVGSGFSISMCGIGIAMYLSGLILELILGKQYDWRPYPKAEFMVPLVCCLLVSLFISDYLWNSFRGFFKYVQGFVLLYAGMDLVRKRHHMRWFLCVMITCLGVSALAAIAQDLIGRDFIYFRESIKYTMTSLRVTGPFKHSNDFATYLVPAFPLALALLIMSIKGKKVLKIIGCCVFILIISYALMRTLSRGAFLSVGFSLFVFSLFFKYRWVGLVGLVTVFLMLWFVPSEFGTRLHELLSNTAGTMKERIYLMNGTIKMIESSPFFGLGLNTYSEWFPKFNPPMPHDPIIMYAHNTYLQTAAEAGLLGIGCYLVYLIAVIRWVVRKTNSSNKTLDHLVGLGVACGVIGIAFNGLFESVMQSTQLRTYFWSLLGVATGLTFSRYFKEKKS